jgi:hypothetical protein
VAGIFSFTGQDMTVKIDALQEFLEWRKMHKIG